MMISQILVLEKQLNSNNESIKKISQQVSLLKDSNSKQLETSQEFQNKLTTINNSNNSLDKVISTKDFNEIIPAIVKIYNISRFSMASGTGTVISSDGYILTNNHVVEGESLAYSSGILAVCIASDEKEAPRCTYTAELVSQGDGELDLALLKINKKLEQKSGKFVASELTEKPKLKYKDILKESNTNPQLGSQISVLGYPSVGGDNISLTQGIYSGVIDDLYFKTDAKINSGNSGGATFDANNKFLGVPTAVSGGQGNIGYIIKSQKVLDFVKSNI